MATDSANRKYPIITDEDLFNSKPLIIRALQEIDRDMAMAISNVDETPKFSGGVENTAIVYKKEDGTYAPALADGSEKSVNLGYADTALNRVYYGGIRKCQFETQIGRRLFLSNSNAGLISTNVSSTPVGRYIGNKRYFFNPLEPGASDIPAGGADGFYLTKISDVDFECQWRPLKLIGVIAGLKITIKNANTIRICAGMVEVQRAILYLNESVEMSITTSTNSRYYVYVQKPTGFWSKDVDTASISLELKQALYVDNQGGSYHPEDQSKRCIGTFDTDSRGDIVNVAGDDAFSFEDLKNVPNEFNAKPHVHNYAPPDLRGLKQGLTLYKRDGKRLGISGGSIEINGDVYHAYTPIEKTLTTETNMVYNIYARICEIDFELKAIDIKNDPIAPSFNSSKGALYHPHNEDERYIGKVTTDSDGNIKTVVRAVTIELEGELVQNALIRYNKGRECFTVYTPAKAEYEWGEIKSKPLQFEPKDHYHMGVSLEAFDEKPGAGTPGVPPQIKFCVDGIYVCVALNTWMRCPYEVYT